MSVNLFKRLFFAVLAVSTVLPIRAAEKPGTLLWTQATGRHTSYDATAAIAPDGTIYAPTLDAFLHAFDRTGRKKWSFPTRSDIKSSPAIGDDGTIYFGCRDRRFYAVTPAGKLKWSFPTGDWIDSSPAIGVDGTVYFGSWDQKFYAVDPAGHKKWEFATAGPIDSSPAIGLDGTIYFGSHDHKFYALNPNGSRQWEFVTQGAIVSSPAIAADGTLYFTSVDGNLYALNPDGTQKWRLHTGGAHASSPVIDAAGDLYVAVNNCMWLVKSNGVKFANWDFTVYDANFPLFMEGSAATTADGKAIFGSDYGSVYAFSPTNAPGGWAVFLGGRITASPAIGPDGTVYIGSYVRNFHAIAGTAPLANSSWPKFRANLRQTGRVERR